MGSVVVSIVVFVLVALILTCIALIIANLVKPSLNWDEIPRCEPVEFCTQKEQAVFNDLTTIMQKSEMLVFCKVGLGCVLKPKKGVPNRDQWSKQLRGEYVDFIICDPKTLKTLLVIMLDDSALTLHKTRVSVVDKACEQANVPLLHVRDYNIPGLEKAVMQKIGARRMGRAVQNRSQPVDMAAG